MVSIKGLFSSFKTLDFLAPNVNLNVAGSSGIKTHVGAFLTLVASGLFTLMSVVIVHAYVRTDSPSVTQEVRYKTEYPKIDFLKHKLMPVVFPYLEDINPIPNKEISKYLTFVANKARYTTTLKEDGSQVQVIDKVQMYYKPCGELMDQGKHLLYLPTVEAGMIHAMTRNYGLCVDYDENDSYVKGRISDLVYEEIYIEAYPCMLEDTSQCATLEELQLVSFIYATTSVNTDLSNKKNPISHMMSSDDYFYLNTNIGVQYQAKFMENSIYDDLGYYFGSTKVDSFFSIEKFMPSVSTRDSSKLHCTKQEVIDDECYWYYSFMYISGGREAVITRTYKDLVSTIGDIGGVKEFIFLIFLMFYTVYNNNQKKKEMVQRIYRLEQESSCLQRMCPRKYSKTSAATQPGASNSPESDDSVKRVPGDVINSAYEIIEDSLDAVTIVEQLNIVKFITHFLVQEYQKNLVPLIALNHDLQNKQKAEKLSRLFTISSQAKQSTKEKEKTAMSMDRSFQVLQLECMQQGEMSVAEVAASNKSIDLSRGPPGFAADSHRTRKGQPGSWDKKLSQTIDKYCYELLSDSIFFSKFTKKEEVEVWGLASGEAKPGQPPVSPHLEKSGFVSQKSILKRSQFSLSGFRQMGRRLDLHAKPSPGGLRPEEKPLRHHI